MTYGQWTNDSISEIVNCFSISLLIILSLPNTAYHIYQLLSPSCEYGIVVPLAVLL